MGAYFGAQQINNQLDAISSLPVGVNNTEEASSPVGEVSLKTLHPLMLESKTKKALSDYSNEVQASAPSSSALGQAFVDEAAQAAQAARRQKEASQATVQTPKVIDLKPKSNLVEVANQLRITGYLGEKTVLINNKSTDYDNPVRHLYFYSATKNQYVHPYLVRTPKGPGLKDPDTGLTVILKAYGLSVMP